MRKSKGFTLVELLVVIGIIALLISILLPSLTRARQAANLVACQSNMKQIYTAILFYAGDNKGLLPYASVPGHYGTAQDMGNGTNGGTFIILSRYLGNQINDDHKDPLSKVFICTEAAPPESGTAYWAPNMQRTVQFSPRAFPNTDSSNGTFAGKPDYPQRKLASIRDSSGKFAFWEGQQLFDWNASSEPSVFGMDGFRAVWGHHFMMPAEESYDQGYVDSNPVFNAGPQVNKDAGWFDCAMRYRHMRTQKDPRGSMMSVGFFDGHVEAKRVGEVRLQDVLING